eukprot:1568515-Prymnesium_polylepis.1
MPPPSAPALRPPGVRWSLCRGAPPKSRQLRGSCQGGGGQVQLRLRWSDRDTEAQAPARPQHLDR